MSAVWHVIEGEAGCAFSVERRCVAIVVDALRASATAAMLLEHGATELLVARTVEDALALKEQFPNALLFGERNALPPPGFDYGNSPREARHGRGRLCIFTTTTGAGRMAACWGAARVLMGSPVNARAAARLAEAEAAAAGCDIVVIPAGLTGDPSYDAQEDWAGAAAITMEAGEPVMGEGAGTCRRWQALVRTEGLERLFAAAPHAANLVRAGLAGDIAFCAQRNVTAAVPAALALRPPGIRAGLL